MYHFVNCSIFAIYNGSAYKLVDEILNFSYSFLLFSGTFRDTHTPTCSISDSQNPSPPKYHLGACTVSIVNTYILAITENNIYIYIYILYIYIYIYI